MSHENRLLAAAEELLARGPMSDEDLARMLYGARGSVAPWVAMLRSLLQGSDRVRRRPDGQWELIKRETGPPLAVAGRKTRARNGRLLELAVAPAHQPGAMTKWRFETFSRPARSFSAGDPEHSDEPDLPFGDVAGTVSALLRDREIWVLDANLPDLLAAEFAAVGMPRPWVAVRVCGNELWTVSGRKRSMEAVRASLDLVPSVGDALKGELEVIARVAAGERVRQPTGKTANCNHTSTLRKAAAAMPEGPGVYSFRESSGAVLYIGSAASLRRRALSYFGEQITLTRGLHGLLDRAEVLESLPLGTHLEAVVEEARLITELEPPYNVQRRVAARQAWLRIGAESPTNVVQVASVPRGDGALYLGPLPNRTSVNAAAAALAALWNFSRRGGNARVSEESQARLEGMRQLLGDPESFCAELRSKLHAAAPGLSARARATMAENVARTERAVLAGELLPMAPDLRSVIVARLDPARDELYLLLVCDLVCRACARSAARDEQALGVSLEALLTVAVVPDEGAPAAKALAARWIHAHRDDASVLPTGLGAREIAARLVGAVRAQAEASVSVPPARGEEWWI